MSQYAINDTSLTAIADAIRTKAGVSKYLFWQEDYTGSSLPTVTFRYNNEYYYCGKVAIPTTATGTITKFDVTFNMVSTSSHVAYAAIFGHNHTTNTYVLLKDYTDRSEVRKDRIISMATEFNSFMNNSDMDHDYLYVSTSRSPTQLYSAFKSIDSDVIAGLNPDTNYLPSEMGEEISNLRDAPTDEDLVITGDCSYRFANGGWNWIIDKYGDDITTYNISNAEQMFSNYNGNTIPFTLNFNPNINSSLYYMLRGCTNITELPDIASCSPSDFGYVFQDCRKIRYIPDSWVDNIDWSYMRTQQYANQSYVFYGCYSLRTNAQLQDLIKNIHGKKDNPQYFYAPYSTQYRQCYALDYILNIPIVNNNISSDMFSQTFWQCERANQITFDLSLSSAERVANWKNQVIELNEHVGYAAFPNHITGYNSGLTEATRITDAASYALLKDDPDSWTTDVNYSRYNHDSAVDTIASLPDTHAYGTNTIKFKGASGALTDGGAINTLTAAEIAVATAKGWTVTLV